MVRFSIAVDRNYTKQGEERQADFISCVTWDKKAEFICKYFSKGQKIALTGSIRTGSYTDKDGNKRNTFDVWADSVEFCESKKQGGTSTETHTQEPQEPTQYDDNDLPF